MKVRMRTQISGSRGDGTQWPRPGSELDVDDDEGAALVANGSAFPVRSDQDDIETREDVGPVRVSTTDTVVESLEKGDLIPGADAETITAQAAERGLYDGTITRDPHTGEYMGDPDAAPLDPVTAEKPARSSRSARSSTKSTGKDKS